MNLPQGDCPEGLGWDVWFRITPNSSVGLCQTRIGYIVLGSILLTMQTVLALACLLGFIITPSKHNWTVRPHLGLCTVYLTIEAVTVWLGMTKKDFYSGDQGSMPISMMFASLSFFYLAVLAHYHKMAKLSGSLLGANPTNYEARLMERGLQSILGRNSKLDKFLFLLCIVLTGVVFLVFCVVLPSMPMPRNGHWYETGDLFARDFIVSLGLWIIILTNLCLGVSSILTLVRLRRYLIEHISSQKRTSKVDAPPDDWHDQITRLITKLTWIIYASCMGLCLGCVFEFCMSLDFILGIRWWSAYLMLVLTIPMAIFILSLSFPTGVLKKLLGMTVASRSSGATDEAKAGHNLGQDSAASTLKSNNQVVVPAVGDIA